MSTKKAPSPAKPKTRTARPPLRGRAARRTVDPAQLRAEADVIDARIRRNAKKRRKRTVALAYDLAEMDEDRRWAAYDFGSLAEYARDRGVEYGASQIRQLVAMVRSLERLPLSKQAFLKGDLPWTRFREHARYATPENEAELLADMRVMTNEQFMERLRRLRGAPVRRKVTIEVTPEEHDQLQAAIAAARAVDPDLTLGQALARICRSYVQATSEPVPPVDAVIVPPTVTTPALEEKAEGAGERSPVQELEAGEAAEEAPADREERGATSVPGDHQGTPPPVQESRRSSRDGGLIIELGRRGLSVRRLDGTILGRATFDRPPGPRSGPQVATPVVTTSDARIRAG